MKLPLHPQLAADTHPLGVWNDHRVLLHRNALVPWIIVVPPTERADFLDLPAGEQQAALEIATAAQQFIKSHWNLAKANFAAIGNVVPQMHLHVIGRTPDDPCWPRPVWGNLTEHQGYPPEEIESIRRSWEQWFTV